MTFWKLVAIALATCVAMPVAAGNAPIIRLRDKANGVADKQGRSLFIIELRDAHGPEPHPSETATYKLGAWHAPRARNLFQVIEDTYGFHGISATSLVGLTIAAYVDEAQVGSMALDSRVERITEASRWTYSAAPWGDRFVAVGAVREWRPWGRIAVGASIADASSPRIYVIDAGIGDHTDLAPVRRVNPAANITGVGCYAHATHVAGVIAAITGNGGVAGIHAGAQLISVSTATQARVHAGVSFCDEPGSATDASVQAAIEAVRLDMNTSPGKAAIANLSLNRRDFAVQTPYNGSLGALNTALRNLATPDASQNYFGVFVAQSAGNAGDDAAGAAYSDRYDATANRFLPSPNDGIMVVGGVDHSGRMVRRVITPEGQTLHQFRNWPISIDEAGSNNGPIVEAWAPSLSILSTFGPPVQHKVNNPDTAENEGDPNTWQRSNTQYNHYLRLSGTSLAAPHVTGVAAAILRNQPTLRSTQLEEAVRSAMFTTGELDNACDPGCPIRIVKNPHAVSDPLGIPLARLVHANYEVRLVGGMSGPGNGTITRAPEGFDCTYGCRSYTPGTTVVLSATPAPGSTFTGWQGACSGTGICTVTMGRDTWVGARFTQ